MNLTVLGIDPGVVHTGCVALKLDTAARAITIHHEVVAGTDVSKVREWVDTHDTGGPLFVEDYNPGNFVRENKAMSEALGRLKAEFPPSVDPVVEYVDNAGIDTLLPLAVLQVFKVDIFATPTHHNDLRSAGKIALRGMLKDKEHGWRQLVSDVVRAELDGDPWAVSHAQ